MTIAEFLRSLVDESLYPGTQLHDEENGDVTRKQIESLSNSHEELASNVQELSASVERIGVKITGYESEGILSPKIVDTIQEMKTIKSDINDLESKVAHLSTDITVIKREIKRQPTGDTHTVALNDGSERKFKVYKSPEGLVKPHVVVDDLLLGKKYVDLTEPLD